MGILGDVLPERGFLGGQEGVLARVPAKEMRCARMRRMVFAAFPDFVKKKCAGLICTAVQIVLEAAFFLACRANQGA